MTTIEEIVAAARDLKPADFVQLRKKLDRVEEQLWQGELAAASEELRESGVTDNQIDQMVVRRRREGRP
jgi:hypothetical protein